MNKLPPIARIKKIAAMLSDGKHITGSKLAKELEVSPKTIYRDLDFMRDRLELPIETDGHGPGPGSFEGGGGYYFTKPVQLCACCTSKL